MPGIISTIVNNRNRFGTTQLLNNPNKNNRRFITARYNRHARKYHIYGAIQRLARFFFLIHRRTMNTRYRIK